MNPFYATNAKTIQDLPKELQALAAPEIFTGDPFGRPRMTIEQFANKLENSPASTGRYSFPFGVLRTQHCRVLTTCNRHGVTWAALPTSLIAGCGCPVCTQERILSNRLKRQAGKVTYDQLAEVFAVAVHGKRLLFEKDAKTWKSISARRFVTIYDAVFGTLERMSTADLIETYRLNVGV